MAKRFTTAQETRLRAAWRRPKARAEIRAKLKERYGIDVQTIRDVLDLVLTYGPEVIRLVMEIVRLFA
jgi:hypothetical protein